MSKHPNIHSFQAAYPVQAHDPKCIGDAFQIWVQASQIMGDLTAPETARNLAKERMEHMWDFATTARIDAAHDMAALYIMAQRTVSVDPDALMETAHCLTYAAAQEAQMIGLYDTWRKLHEARNTLSMNDETLAGVGEISWDIEAQIAAIPATTARMLAIKVEVFREHQTGTLGERSLCADLAELTGNPVQPV